MSVTSGGTALKPLSSGGSRSASAGSAGMSMTFLTAHFVAVAVPDPDRRRQVLEADDGVDEAVGLGRVVRRPQLEHDLVLLAEVELLQVLALVQIPEVQPLAVLRAEQDSGTSPFSNMSGVPHSLVISVSWPRCHQKS